MGLVLDTSPRLTAWNMNSRPKNWATPLQATAASGKPRGRKNLPSPIRMGRYSTRPAAALIRQMEKA